MGVDDTDSQGMVLSRQRYPKCVGFADLDMPNQFVHVFGIRRIDGRKRDHQTIFGIAPSKACEGGPLVVRVAPENERSDLLKSGLRQTSDCVSVRKLYQFSLSNHAIN